MPQQDANKHDRTFKAALLAAVSAAAILSAAPVRAESFEEVEKIFYADKNHTYCDVRYLAALWQKTDRNAVRTAVMIMRMGRTQFLERDLEKARREKLLGRGPTKHVECVLADANNPNYSYDDYYALQDYFIEEKGFNKRFDSKAWVLGQIDKGWNAQVIADLAAARAAGY